MTMHQTACECGEINCPGDGGHYYVTARNDDGRYVALLGPFETHAEALANVQRGTRLAYDSGDPRAPWYAYGTARRKDGQPWRTAFTLDGQRRAS